MWTGRRRLRVPPLAVAAVAAVGANAPPAASAAACDRVASTTGSDSAAGTQDAPYGTPQKLVDSLAVGQTGCLREGTYAQDVRFSRGGTLGARVTVTSHPGEHAKLVGRLWIAAGADFVTVSNLSLDGTNAPRLPSPTVTANDAAFTGDDVTNGHTAICFNIGDDAYGHAARTLIQGNRIHDCGVLPPTNHDHGIYVSNATDTQILDNLIYANADRGIQLYPDAQRTTIERNVIDGNGEGVLFSGLNGVPSDDNRVAHNAITNSGERYNVESYYPGDTPPARNNLVTDNCVHNGHHGDIADQVGFRAVDNLVADPQYANPAAGDFGIPPSNPCAALLRGEPLASAFRFAPPAVPPTPYKRAAPARVARAARLVARLIVTARIRGRRVLVRGRLSHPSQRSSRLLVELLDGRRWRTACRRSVYGRRPFSASLELRRRRTSPLGVRVTALPLAPRILWVRIPVRHRG